MVVLVVHIIVRINISSLSNSKADLPQMAHLQLLIDLNWLRQQFPWLGSLWIWFASHSIEVEICQNVRVNNAENVSIWLHLHGYNCNKIGNRQVAMVVLVVHIIVRINISSLSNSKADLSQMAHLQLLIDLNWLRQQFPWLGSLWIWFASHSIEVEICQNVIANTDLCGSITAWSHVDIHNVSTHLTEKTRGNTMLQLKLWFIMDLERVNYVCSLMFFVRVLEQADKKQLSFINLNHHEVYSTDDSLIIHETMLFVYLLIPEKNMSTKDPRYTIFLS